MPYKSWSKPISYRIYNPNFKGPQKRGRKRKGIVDIIFDSIFGPKKTEGKKSEKMILVVAGQ